MKGECRVNGCTEKTSVSVQVRILERPTRAGSLSRTEDIRLCRDHGSDLFVLLAEPIRGLKLDPEPELVVPR